MSAVLDFPRRVYRWSAIYGIVLLAPQYVLEERVGRDMPPPLTHPEYFYGFIGLALAWQVAFLAIARDPVRFRPMMPVTFLEKLAFGIPAIVLYLQGRLAAPTLVFGLLDLALGVLFFIAWRRTPAA